MQQAIDLYVTYRFLKNLVLPYEKWKAYDTGVIDKSGNILIQKEKRNQIQRDSLGYFDVLTLNLKNLLRKLPGGKTQFASYAAAMVLMKEKDKIAEEIDFDLAAAFMENLTIVEEIIANNVGTGNIASTGVGPNGEPPVRKRKKSDILKRIQKTL